MRHLTIGEQPGGASPELTVVRQIGLEQPPRTATGTLEGELRRELAGDGGSPAWRAWVAAAAERAGLT